MILGQQRVSFTGETVAYVGQHQLACTPCALSIAGMILLPPASARAGLQMRLVLKLVELGKQVVVDAVLTNEVWEQGRYAWEVQFVGMSDAVRDLFARFVVARLSAARVATTQVEALPTLARVPTGPQPRLPTGPQPRQVGVATHVPTSVGAGAAMAQKSSPGFYASGGVGEDLSRTLTGVGDVAAGKRTAGAAPAVAPRPAASLSTTAARQPSPAAPTSKPALSTKKPDGSEDVLEDVPEDVSGVRPLPSDMDSDVLKQYARNPRRLEELYLAALDDLERPTKPTK
jgi:hypothetical protein